MTHVVTGASGHIGANLVRRLLADGHRVRAVVHRDRRGLEGLDVETVEADVTDKHSLIRAFRDAEVVYHLAARISLSSRDKRQLREVNVDGTDNVLESCSVNRVSRLVYMSTVYAFEQKPVDQTLDENRALVTRETGTAYDYSKSLAEVKVRRAIDNGLDAVILYPTAVVGPHDFGPSHMGAAIIRIASGRMPFLVSGGCDFVDVRDVVNGTLAARDLAPPGSGYILGGHYLTLAQLAGWIDRLFELGISRFIVPQWLTRVAAPLSELIYSFTDSEPLFTPASLAALDGNRRISCGKAVEALEYEPRSIRETILDTILWYSTTGQLQLPD